MVANLDNRSIREFSIFDICTISKKEKEGVIFFTFFRYFSMMEALSSYSLWT